jgi:hypothetical protein
MNDEQKNQNKLVSSDHYRSLVSLKVERQTIRVDESTFGWIETKLNKATLREIENAWYQSTIISLDDGKIWFRAERVNSVLRTDKASASKWVILLPEHLKIEIDECEYVDTVALVASLHQRMSRSRDDYHRAYREFSWAMLTALRRSPQVQQLHRLLQIDLKKELSELKKKRMKDYQITHDELTGEKLFKRTAAFSHIRSKDIFPELALFVWNGLVINEATHEIITSESVVNEKELLKLCEHQGWSSSWHDDFRLNFENCEVANDSFFKDFSF